MDFFNGQAVQIKNEAEARLEVPTLAQYQSMVSLNQSSHESDHRVVPHMLRQHSMSSRDLSLSLATDQVGRIAPITKRESNGWNHVMEQNVAHRIKDSHRRSIKHHATGRYLKSVNNALEYPIVISTTLVGAVSGMVAQGESTEIVAARYIVSTIMVISGIAIGLRKAFKLEENIAKHKEASIEFDSFRNDLETILSFDRKDRPDGKMFLLELNEREKKIKERSPIIAKKTNDLIKKEVSFGSDDMKDGYVGRNNEYHVHSPLIKKHGDSPETSQAESSASSHISNQTEQNAAAVKIQHFVKNHIKVPMLPIPQPPSIHIHRQESKSGMTPRTSRTYVPSQTPRRHTPPIETHSQNDDVVWSGSDGTANDLNAEKERNYQLDRYTSEENVPNIS